MPYTEKLLPFPLGALMPKSLKVLLLSLLLLGIYPAATWLVLNFYQDDPAQMFWTDREAFNRKFIRQLDLTKAPQQDLVQQKLGGPDITEAYQLGDQLYQLAYYRTQRAISDGITTKAECTALLYQNHQVVAVGSAAEQQFQRQKAATEQP